MIICFSSLCGKETTLAATDNCNVRLFSRGQLATKGLIKGLYAHVYT